MIYREYLVMRKALAWFACFALALMLFVYATTVTSKSVSIGYGGIANGAGWLVAIFASVFGVALGNGSRERRESFGHCRRSVGSSRYK